MRVAGWWRHQAAMLKRVLARHLLLLALITTMFSQPLPTNSQMQASIVPNEMTPRQRWVRTMFWFLACTWLLKNVPIFLPLWCLLRSSYHMQAKSFGQPLYWFTKELKLKENTKCVILNDAWYWPVSRMFPYMPL